VFDYLDPQPPLLAIRVVAGGPAVMSSETGMR
jgi:hypothetical protein